MVIIRSPFYFFTRFVIEQAICQDQTSLPTLLPLWLVLTIFSPPQPGLISCRKIAGLCEQRDRGGEMCCSSIGLSAAGCNMREGRARGEFANQGSNEKHRISCQGSLGDRANAAKRNICFGMTIACCRS
jgi:hypothetical protein